MPVAINLVAISLSILPEDYLSQVLLRALTEWLSLLRRVDTSKPDPVLVPIAVQQCKRVPICNAYYPAFEDLGACDEAKKNEASSGKTRINHPASGPPWLLEPDCDIC